MKILVITFCICFVLSVAIAGLADDQEKKRIAVIVFHEEESPGSDVWWKPSDFGKRMHNAVEKTKKFIVVDRKKVEKIENSNQYHGRMNPDQEAQVKDLGARYIIYASIKKAKGSIYANRSNAQVVLGLLVLDLESGKTSDEFLVPGGSLDVGMSGEQDFADRDFIRRDTVERLLNDAGNRAIKTAAKKLAAWQVGFPTK